jgi:hypothetical protein
MSLWNLFCARSTADVVHAFTRRQEVENTTWQSGPTVAALQQRIADLEAALRNEYHLHRHTVCPYQDGRCRCATYASIRLLLPETKR